MRTTSALYLMFGRVEEKKGLTNNRDTVVVYVCFLVQFLFYFSVFALWSGVPVLAIACNRPLVWDLDGS